MCPQRADRFSTLLSWKALRAILLEKVIHHRSSPTNTGVSCLPFSNPFHNSCVDIGLVFVQGLQFLKGLHVILGSLISFPFHDLNTHGQPNLWYLAPGHSEAVMVFHTIYTLRLFLGLLSSVARILSVNTILPGCLASNSDPTHTSSYFKQPDLPDGPCTLKSK